jgi:hypothetical protein
MNTSDLHSCDARHNTSDVHSCNARLNTSLRKYSGSLGKRSRRTAGTRHMTEVGGSRGYLLVVCTEGGIYRDGTSVSVFEHGLELKIVLNSDDEWHVVSMQFPRDGSSNKLLVVEHYLLIGLHPKPY